VPWFYFEELRGRVPHDASRAFARQAQHLSRNTVRGRFYRGLLIAIEKGCSVRIHNRGYEPGLGDILRYLDHHKPVVLFVPASEYYVVPERWMHTLAVIPHLGYTGKFIDPYRRRGTELWGDEWEDVIARADKYDWHNWHNGLITFGHCKAMRRLKGTITQTPRR
jgi:hypothetical protein